MSFTMRKIRYGDVNWLSKVVGLAPRKPAFLVKESLVFRSGLEPERHIFSFISSKSVPTNVGLSVVPFGRSIL